MTVLPLKILVLKVLFGMCWLSKLKVRCRTKQHRVVNMQMFLSAL